MPPDPTATATATAREIVAGLCAAQASIAPKYFYDTAGSALFEQITQLPEYYLTRTERAIMATHADALALRIGPGATVIEAGAGNCEKARTLCATIRPRCFVGVDIAAAFLQQAVAGLRREFPSLDVRSVVADLLDEIVLPADLPSGRRLVFYPGSSIGNFAPEAALGLLQRLHRLTDADGALLIGVDLVKSKAILEAAYDDAAGVTAAFNLNVLRHINRLLTADFDLAHWRHRSFFNEEQSRIEMHLEARCATQVSWPTGCRNFRRAERIHTENSYKYRVADFAGLLRRAGFGRHVCWTDAQQWFAVFLAEP